MQQAGKEGKETEVSDERKGSNEPILPMEEVLATALSSESHPDCPAGPGADGQLDAGADNDANGAADSLKDIGGSLRQASVQDLEMQHQHMAAAQEQVSVLAALVLLGAAVVFIFRILKCGGICHAGVAGKCALLAYYWWPSDQNRDI